MDELERNAHWIKEIKKAKKEADAGDFASEAAVDVVRKRGGRRPGAGRKAVDGASGLVTYSVALPPELRAWANSVGAARIREVLAAAREEDGK